MNAVLEKRFVSASLTVRDSINPEDEHIAEQARRERVDTFSPTAEC